jgi:hypothetical protein
VAFHSVAKSNPVGRLRGDWLEARSLSYSPDLRLPPRRLLEDVDTWPGTGLRVPLTFGWAPDSTRLTLLFDSAGPIAGKK